MKKLWLQLLCVLLALLLPAAALAEEALTVEAEPIGSEAPEEVIEEVIGELSAPEPSEDASASEIFDEETSTAVAELPEAALAQANETPEVDPAPMFDEAIAAKSISIKKSAKKTVYLEVPYVLKVKGGIKSVKSSASSVATAAKDGTLTLSKKGKAKLTIKTGKGKKFTVTLTVKAAPAPTDLKAKTSGTSMKLSWTEAPYATRYLVQQSANGNEWTDYKVVDASHRSLDISDAATPSGWFRVVAILGDHFGGASAPLQVLGPLTSVKVICQESYSNGPTDHMNVVWKGCDGATEYIVYHAALPSDHFVEIGRTTKSYFPVTRSATKLDAYKVKPVFGSVEMPESDAVTLWTGVQDNVLPPSSLTSGTGIILLVNKKAQVVTAYGKDAKGKYTIPLRHMICSSGKDYDRTKNGTFKLRSREGEWYKYPSGCYIRWPSTYRDGYYFHSVLYKSKKKIYSNTIDDLGTRQSLGCVRLKVLDAKWVYKHCPKGTTVYICDGKKLNKLKSALYPKTVKVSGF